MRCKALSRTSLFVDSWQMHTFLSSWYGELRTNGCIKIRTSMHSIFTPLLQSKARNVKHQAPVLSFKGCCSFCLLEAASWVRSRAYSELLRVGPFVRQRHLILIYGCECYCSRIERCGDQAKSLPPLWCTFPLHPLLVANWSATQASPKLGQQNLFLEVQARIDNESCSFWRMAISGQLEMMMRTICRG